MPRLIGTNGPICKCFLIALTAALLILYAVSQAGCDRRITALIELAYGCCFLISPAVKLNGECKTEARHRRSSRIF